RAREPTRRARLPLVDVRPLVADHALAAIRPRADVVDSPVGLLGRDLRDAEPADFLADLAVHEGAMDVVDAVLEAAEVAARPGIHACPQDPLPLELRVARELWGLALAQVGEEQPRVLLHRVALDLDPAAKWFGLRGLLHALPIRA